MIYRKSTLCLILALTMVVAGSVTLFAQDVSKLEYPKLNKLVVPEVEKVTLDNGLRIYILEDRKLPLFKASVRINCGAFLEPADKIGLADMCGSVLRTGGTEKWTGDELDELLEGIGGSVETSLGNLNGRASINVLSEYSDLGLEVLSEILR
ncbi:MAG: insulinase family protein, partial [candidate division Zixibacteria bacterium]